MIGLEKGTMLRTYLNANFQKTIVMKFKEEVKNVPAQCEMGVNSYKL